jgi:hypothetical protein
MYITPVTLACQFLSQLFLTNINNKNEEVQENKQRQQKKNQQEGNHTATTTTTTTTMDSVIEGVAGCVISLLQVPSAVNIHSDMESFHQLVDQLLVECCGTTSYSYEGTGTGGAVGVHNDDDGDDDDTTRVNIGGDMGYPPSSHSHNNNNHQLAHHLLLTFLKAPLACMSVVKQSADAFSLTIQELLSATIMESNDKPSYGGRTFTSTTNTIITGGIDPVNSNLTAPSLATHDPSPHNHHHISMSLSSPHDHNNVHTLEVIIYQLQDMVGSGLSALPGWIIEQQQQQQQQGGDNNDGEEGEEYASEDLWQHYHHHHNDNHDNTCMIDIDSYLSELSNTVQEAVNSAKLLAYTHPAVSSGASRVATQLMHALQIISTQGI